VKLALFFQIAFIFPFAFLLLIFPLLALFFQIAQSEKIRIYSFFPFAFLLFTFT